MTKINYDIISKQIKDNTKYIYPEAYNKYHPKIKVPVEVRKTNDTHNKSKCDTD